MHTRRVPLWLIAGLYAALPAPVARAQPAETPIRDPAADTPGTAAPNESQPDESQAETAPKEESRAVEAEGDAPVVPGHVKVIVFLQNSDLPPEGIEVSIAGVSPVATNQDGAVLLDLPPGQHHLLLSIPGSLLERPDTVLTKLTETVAVQSGIQSQVLITLDAAGSAMAVDIEAPQVGPDPAEKAATRAAQEQLPKGFVEGMVLSEEDGTPIANAQVFVRGYEQDLVTDDQGRFKATLPAGTYAVSVLHAKYSTQTTPEFEIKGDATESLEIKLVPRSIELEEYVVTAPYVEGGVAALQAERRNTTAVADVIGAEQMSKSGDSTAAAALSRVTGLTVVGGKFVYVRGMGERYSSTLMNGSAVPSPEPERRVVPLDLFPAGVLESVIVQKTYSPERPGEFGGGVVQMRTKRFPEKFTFEISGSLGGNTQTTFRDILTSRGGDLDWLGIDDGSRDLPSAIGEREISALQPRTNPDGFSAEEREAIAEAFPRNYNLFRKTAPPDAGASVTVGDTLKLGEIPFGYVGSVFYDREYERTLRTVRDLVVSSGEARPRRVFTSETATESVKTGGIVNLGSKYADGHEISFTTLLLRITDNDALYSFGDDPDVDKPVRWTRLRFIERQLLTQQVSGVQRFEKANNLEFDWRYSFSKADRDEPDRRQYRYDDEGLDAPDYQFSTLPSGNERVFSTLSDKVHDLGLDVIQPFSLKDELVSKVSVGGAATFRQRDVDTRRFNLAARNTGRGSLAGPGNRGLDPESLFSPENLDPDGYLVQELTLPSDAYRADQKIFAGYAMTELAPWSSWQFMVGARVERATQEVESFDRFNGEVDERAKLNNTDLLPAGTITWKFAQDMQLRFGVSRTVSRPDFRELSSSRFFDVESSREIYGNPELVRTTILNLDTRWEWYLSGDETVSVGGFVKDFKDPIESVGIAGSGLPQSWVNAEAAHNLGIEIEARKRLGDLDESLDDFYAAANVAWINSKVEVGNPTHPAGSVVVTETSRPLQGQSPYVINVQLGFDKSGDSTGMNAALLYNVFGRRIAEVGSSGLPDIYEEPVQRLDFVFGWKFNNHLRWGVKAKNILNPEVKQTQGGKITQAGKKGVELSTGLTWSY